MDIKEPVIHHRKSDHSDQENSCLGIRRKDKKFFGENTQKSDGDIDIDKDIDELPASKDEAKSDTQNQKENDKRQVAGKVFGYRKRRKQMLEKIHNIRTRESCS